MFHMKMGNHKQCVAHTQNGDVRDTKGRHCKNIDFAPKHKAAVWTLLEGEEDFISAEVMGQSVKNRSTLPLDLVVMELKRYIFVQVIYQLHLQL